MKKQTGENQWKKILPEFLAVLLCLLLMGIGISQKEGYHMDELLSFELADARYNPWIVPTQPVGRLAKFVDEEIQGTTLSATVGNLKDTIMDVLKNRGSSKLLSYKADVYEEPVWITDKQFRDYITVDGSDAFDYLSVYFNVKDDNHPPVHFMLLHTMSSIFQRTLSPLLGCAINLISLGITLWLLLRLGRQLTDVFLPGMDGRWLGMTAVLLYGMSTGALATVLLIRMYGLLSCLCVALLSIHVEKCKNQEFDRKNKGLTAVTVLGFLTQYFFLFYCLLLAAVTAAVLMQSRRKKELWIYIRSMVTAAVIGLFLFPFAIADVFSSSRGTEALGNLASGFRGYGERILTFGKILAERTVGIPLFVGGCMAGVVLLVVWLVRVIRRCRVQVQGEREPAAEASRISVGAIVAILTIPAAGYFLLASRMSPYLVDRYIMPIFPFVSLLLALLLCWFGRKISEISGWKTRNAALCMLAVILLVQGMRLIHYDGEYLYKGYRQQEQLAEAYASDPCICVYAGVGYYENLPEFMHYSKTLLLTEQELENREDTESLEALDHVVVMIKPGVEEAAALNTLQEKYRFFLEETLMSSGVHGDSIYLLGKK